MVEEDAGGGCGEASFPRKREDVDVKEPVDPEDCCFDCGDAKQHEDACPSTYCRRCSEKAGHRYAFFVRLDRDRVRETFGRELAEKIFELDES
jgi:hypothetical protein